MGGLNSTPTIRFMPIYPTSSVQALRVATAPLLATACLFAAAWQTAAAQNADAATSANGAPTSSRLISASELDDYLARVLAELPMTTRERDPFGAPQDPDAKPTPPPTPLGNARQITETSATLGEVVRLINITTVMPADRKFLVGTRSFGTGDVIPINYRGRPYRVRVEEVTSKRIRFRNIENDDTATRELDILPAGMSAGGDRGAIPGLVPTGPDVPIDLE